MNSRKVLEKIYAATVAKAAKLGEKP